MSNSKVYREKKEMAFEAYLGGMVNPKQLSEHVGCAPITIQRWVRDGKWDQIEKEERNLDRKIDVARKRALLTALKSYAADPESTALQSLVGILKQEIARTEPSKELRDHIVIFLDQTTDFMLERGLDRLLEGYQAIVMDLAEYLRMKNS